MWIEGKIRYEDKTNTAYKYIRIYYERSKPSTCRPTYFGHYYDNPEVVVIKRMYYYKDFKNQFSYIKY